MKIFKSGIFSAIVALFLATAAWAEITVRPLSLKVPIPSGGKATTGFWVENVGKSVAEVRITLHDWWRTPEGKLQILPPGKLDGSCAPWVTYSDASLRLTPGERVWISVQIEVPEDAIGDHWALFLVAEYPPEEEAGEALGQTRVVVAYAVKLLRQDPENASPAGEIREVVVASTSPLKLRIIYANIGNAHTTNRGTVEVRDVFGETVRKFEIEEFPTLPGEERIILVEDPTGELLPDGIYYAFATIDFGGEYMVQGGVLVQVPAPESVESEG